MPLSPPRDRPSKDPTISLSFSLMMKGKDGSVAFCTDEARALELKFDAKESWLQVRGLSIEAEMPGSTQKRSLLIILDEIPLTDSRAFLRVNLKKVLLL